LPNVQLLLEGLDEPFLETLLRPGSKRLHHGVGAARLLLVEPHVERRDLLRGARVNPFQRGRAQRHLLNHPALFIDARGHALDLALFLLADLGDASGAFLH
jgi:hypothetical protein